MIDKRMFVNYLDKHLYNDYLVIKKNGVVEFRPTIKNIVYLQLVKKNSYVWYEVSNDEKLKNVIFIARREESLILLDEKSGNFFNFFMINKDGKLEGVTNQYVLDYAQIFFD